MRGDETRGNLPRTMVATFIGQVTEWYDYGIYALVAPQIAQHFFPSNDKTASLLATLAVFGIAFAARPIGGLLIGAYGDLVGRRTVLVASLLMMTFATAFVAILPGVETIGYIAPALLVVARFLQGISAAGESTAAITFVAESAPVHRKGLYVALLLSGNSCGFLLATMIIWMLRVVLGETVFAAWGWRAGFLLALPLGLVGLHIRRTLAESKVFETLKAQKTLSKRPIHDTLVHGWRQLLQAMGISALSFVANYLLVAFLPIALHEKNIDTNIAAAMAAITTGALMVSYPLFGALSDKIGRRTVLIWSAGTLTALGWPFFALSVSGTAALAIPALVGLALPTAAFIACLGLYCTEFIDQSRVMTTYSTGFNLAGAIFGGSSLWMFANISHITDNLTMPGLYLSAVALISLMSILTIKPEPAAHR